MPVHNETMGNIQFNNNKILFSGSNKIAMDSSCCCGCTGCSGTAPNQLSITIAGVTGWPCCSDFNDTFVLTLTPHASGRCQWEYSGAQCDITAYMDGLTLRVEIVGAVGVCQFDFSYAETFGATPDCSAWNNQSVTYNTQTPFSICNAAASTCLATAV